MESSRDPNIYPRPPPGVGSTVTQPLQVWTCGTCGPGSQQLERIGHETFNVQFTY